MPRNLLIKLYISEGRTFKSLLVQKSSSLYIDSKECIAKAPFTATFKRAHEMFDYLLDLIEEEIKARGEESFPEILSGNYETILPISYWSWFDRRSDILEKLTEYGENEDLVFSCSFINNHLENYQSLVFKNDTEFYIYEISIYHLVHLLKHL